VIGLPNWGSLFFSSGTVNLLEQLTELRETVTGFIIKDIIEVWGKWH
jgi:hypothetical protein